MMFCDSAPFPEVLRKHRHRGNYRGAFTSIADLGNILRPVVGVSAGLPPAARMAIVLDLHLRSEVWPVEHHGLVHVFGKPGSPADHLLASERPPLTGEDELSSEPAPARPLLTLVVIPEAHAS